MNTNTTARTALCALVLLVVAASVVAVAVLVERGSSTRNHPDPAQRVGYTVATQSAVAPGHWQAAPTRLMPSRTTSGRNYVDIDIASSTSAGTSAGAITAVKQTWSWWIELPATGRDWKLIAHAPGAPGIARAPAPAEAANEAPQIWTYWWAPETGRLVPVQYAPSTPASPGDYK